MGYGIDDGPASFTTNLTDRLAIGILIRIREPRISTATISAQRPNSSSLPPPFSRGYKRSTAPSIRRRRRESFQFSLARDSTRFEREAGSPPFSPLVSCRSSSQRWRRKKEEGGGRTGEGGEVGFSKEREKRNKRREVVVLRYFYRNAGRHATPISIIKSFTRQLTGVRGFPTIAGRVYRLLSSLRPLARINRFTIRR